MPSNILPLFLSYIHLQKWVGLFFQQILLLDARMTLASFTVISLNSKSLQVVLQPMSWRKLLSSFIAFCPPWPCRSKFPFREILYASLHRLHLGRHSQSREPRKENESMRFLNYNLAGQISTIESAIYYWNHSDYTFHCFLINYFSLISCYQNSEISVFQVWPNWGKDKYWNNSISH